jgi:hypothetical protein
VRSNADDIGSVSVVVDDVVVVDDDDIRAERAVAVVRTTPIDVSDDENAVNAARFCLICASLDAH